MQFSIVNCFRGLSFWLSARSSSLLMLGGVDDHLPAISQTAWYCPTVPVMSIFLFKCFIQSVFSCLSIVWKHFAQTFGSTTLSELQTFYQMFVLNGKPTYKRGNMTSAWRPCLALPSVWAGSYTCPALRPYQFGQMRIPKSLQKVTSNGYKAVVGYKAETSTKALVTCSKCSHVFGQLLVRSYPPGCRNLSGHRSKAPPPRQGGWPRWGSMTSPVAKNI